MTQSSPVRALRALPSFVLLITVAYAQAATPTLQWDANPEPTILGYRVYSGSSSRNYTQVVDVGLQTSVPLTNFSSGITHYLTVTAYDQDRVESLWSDEVWYTPAVDGVTTAQLPFRLTPGRSLTTIQFNGRAGQHCRIAASTDLHEWQEIYSSILPANIPVTWFDAGSDAQPMRFYRVVATPP